MGDLERLTSRAALGVAHARDLIALRGFLGRLPGLAEELSGLGTPLLATLGEEITPLHDLQKLLEEALEDEPPLLKMAVLAPMPSASASTAVRV